LRSLVLGVADGAGVGLYDLPHHHDPASPPEPEKMSLCDRFRCRVRMLVG
jgi:hypothetical protein